MTIGNVKVTIRKGDQALDNARMSIEKANAKLADATALAIAALHDSERGEARRSSPGRPSVRLPTAMSVQAFLYVVAVILLVLASLPVPTRGISLALLGAACALLAYAWPLITG
ncbi:hypothetical protein AB0K35_21060 [Micromonospora sp. NPDC053740]|uniref:hypothetical protein n=1 Tax=Micromonospora TaxID=1873 RepID=UPI001EE9A75A|nr:hypothetical protein [Micromonospora alfalfae]MCG5465066.1 hypothetical protein [Micromonospora alfalfae]